MKKLLFVLCASALLFAGCDTSEEGGGYDPSKDGIIGNWKAKGANVSILLQTYFHIDSISADFKSDNTYSVISYAGGVATNFTGTFLQTKPATGTIWTIKLNQSKPSAVTSEGIFEVTATASSTTMKYEVVQTEPSLGTPPTPQAGFGSSNGGALGLTNIQTYTRVK